MRTFVIAAALVSAVAVLPVASAQPDCIQVYPWSELCQGDVQGFLCAFHVCVETAEPACDGLRDCLALLEPSCPGGPPCPPDPTAGWD